MKVLALIIVAIALFVFIKKRIKANSKKRLRSMFSSMSRDKEFSEEISENWKLNGKPEEGSSFSWSLMHRKENVVITVRYLGGSLFIDDKSKVKVKHYKSARKDLSNN